jgi:hypothetical protein
VYGQPCEDEATAHFSPRTSSFQTTRESPCCYG